MNEDFNSPEYRKQREEREGAQTIARVDQVGKLIAKLDALPPTAWKEEACTWNREAEPDLTTKLDSFRITMYGRRGLPSDHNLSVRSGVLIRDVLSYSGDGRLGDFYFKIAGKLRNYREEQDRKKYEAEEGQRGKLRNKFFRFLGISS